MVKDREAWHAAIHGVANSQAHPNNNTASHPEEKEQQPDHQENIFSSSSSYSACRHSLPLRIIGYTKFPPLLKTWMKASVTLFQESNPYPMISHLIS